MIIENVEIIDIANDGNAIGKYNNIVIFIKNAVPGDVVDVKILKKKKNFWEGTIEKIHKENKLRSIPFCSHYGICGGCKWQHMTYEGQLYFKQKQVKDAFKKIGGVLPQNIIPILPSPITKEYRNKLEFTFSTNKWTNNYETDKTLNNNDNLALGFHIAGMFNKIVDIEKCYLQNTFSNNIRLTIKNLAIKLGLSFYNIKESKGLLRNIIIRNTLDDQWMLIVVFGYNDTQAIELLLKNIKTSLPNLTSLMYVINSKKNDSITDLPVYLYYGKDYITETLENLIFKIGPLSFFQTNSIQAARLYSIVKNFANLSGNEIVYDLYTGIGTIANFIASHTYKIIGIDNIEPAIKDARENSMFNKIKNTTFITGDIAKIFNNELINTYGSPDVVITDPPRSGMHPKVIEQLLKVQPTKIIYVSCNPATQSRDIAMLKQIYSINKTQAVDMFPHTSHVENVALLIKN
ncbi:MAG TPA: 23S rRNA (uracil(1939)-C(5))-methyltransferase RlmD [Bacteroidales bacterium]|nr:23S rRNA (uracil(1939)-C(5))-methyltransferase RlmD [Bacteroidales bacterium]